MSEKRGFRHVDLPTDHIGKHGRWVPPKSHIASEIEELTGKPGSLIAKRQHTGMRVATEMIRILNDAEMSQQARDLIAGGSYNTAFFEHADTITKVTRRRLVLQDAAELSGRLTMTELTDHASNMFEAAEIHTGNRVSAIKNSRMRHASSTPIYKEHVGIHLGEASLLLGAAPLADEIANAWDVEEQQELLRRGATHVRSVSRELRYDLNGEYPSIAQLAYRYSPMPVNIQNTGDQCLVDALDEAQTKIFESETT